MMVKTIVNFLFAVITWGSTLAQARAFVFAGPQTSTVKYTIKNVKQPAESKFGFRAGLGLKVNFDEQLYFSPALSWSNTGYKVKFNMTSSPPDSTAKDNNT